LSHNGVEVAFKPFRFAPSTFGRRFPIAPWSSLLAGLQLELEVLLQQVLAQLVPVLVLVRLVQEPAQREPLALMVEARLAKRRLQEPLVQRLQHRKSLLGCFHSPLRPSHRSRPLLLLFAEC
jgi:hypothetical protein